MLHCADIHIGASCGIKGVSARRKSEVLQTFLRIVEYGEEKKADLILIAGDLFDGHRVSGDTLEEISDVFKKFSGRIFISPGNHDFYGVNTFWEEWILPENVYVFKTSAEEVIIPEIGVKIHGGAFTELYKTQHTLSLFEADENMINISVLHGDISAESSYGPVSVEEIRNSRMDYIALGHIHTQSGVLREGKTFYAYCGCPEGQGFDELFEKGFLFGQVDKGSANIEFVPFCKRQFVEECIDISSAEKKSDIKDIILHKISEKYGEEGFEWLFKIVLKGETDIVFSSSDIETALENELYFVKVKKNLRLPIQNLEAVAKENSVKGIFVRKMLERRRCGEDVTRAVQIGLTAFLEEVDFDED